MLERLGGGDGDDERARIGVADVLGGEDHHPAGDEARVLAAFEHRGEVVDGRVGIAAAHRLDERGDDVVVLVAVPVVAQRALAGCVGDVTCLERRALGDGRLPGELERGERAAGIAAGLPHDRLDDVLRNLDLELRRASTDDGCHLGIRERLELDDGATGEEGRVDLEVGVLGGRPDQRQQAALDARQQGVLLALVEAVDLVEEEDRARPVRPEPVAGTLEDAAHVVDARRHGRELLEDGARGLGDDPCERRLADAGRAVEDHRRRPVALDREPERRSVGEHVPLADELVERPRPDALRQRSRLALVHRGSVREEVAHAMSLGRRPCRCRAAPSGPALSPHASRLCAMSQETFEPPLNRPVLPGEARSDYERYLNTEELLALQKGPDEWVHRDELLFQVVHQSSELWLKLAGSDTAAAAALVDEDDLGGALRLLRRASMCMRFITGQLDMLEQMSPWEYQEIRKVLGHGSGFDSPGVKELRPAMARLGEAFHAARERAGLSLLDLYVHGRDHELLYQLAEALMELDEWLQTWRIRHYRVVARVIGEHVIGTQGTPVEVLGRLIHRVEYQELWDVRNELTAKSQAEA